MQVNKMCRCVATVRQLGSVVLFHTYMLSSKINFKKSADLKSGIIKTHHFKTNLFNGTLKI